ncbi:hypothetical protein [Enterococcus avium]|uniref:hypothetical protein n=1 Tax=Enterococcus avium TaxID=33945 RepID=UPI001F564C38|nr:hypothetical protein [Enterococcus avium]
MQEYISFHGTDKSVANEKIKFSPDNILITTYRSEVEKGIKYRNQKSKSKPKPPGSLGYGFYTFVYSEQIAKGFISRQTIEYKIIEVHSKFEEDQILDLNVQEVREKFHVFRSEFIKHSEHILKLFGTPSNNYKQHVMDGIVIEMFIDKLFKNEQKSIKAVLAWTYTPCDEQSENIKFVSFIPNGLELCIRDKKQITRLKEGDV